MDDTVLIYVACLAILLLTGISRTFLVLAVILAVRSAAQKRQHASGAFCQGYPQVAGPLPATSTSPAEASLGYRLWELDSLRGRGVISFDEYAFGRQAALAGDAALVRHGTT